MGQTKILKVLCAEDQKIYAEIVITHFENRGHVVERAENGQKAWDRISMDLKRFDVIVTDHQMPFVDGLSLVGRLRSAKYPGKIIVYAAKLTPDQASLYRELQVDGIVPKGQQGEGLVKLAEGLFRMGCP